MNQEEISFRNVFENVQTTSKAIEVLVEKQKRTNARIALLKLNARTQLTKVFKQTRELATEIKAENKQLAETHATVFADVTKEFAAVQQLSGEEAKRSSALARDFRGQAERLASITAKLQAASVAQEAAKSKFKKGHKDLVTKTLRLGINSQLKKVKKLKEETTRTKTDLSFLRGTLIAETQTMHAIAQGNCRKTSAFFGGDVAETKLTAVAKETKSIPVALATSSPPAVTSKSDSKEEKRSATSATIAEQETAQLMATERLHRGIVASNYDEVVAALNAGADPNHKVKWTNTVYEGQSFEETTSPLLQAFASKECNGELGTKILLALINNDRMLGTTLHEKNKRGHSAINWATARKNDAFELISALVKKGVDPTTTSLIWNLTTDSQKKAKDFLDQLKIQGPTSAALRR